MEKKRYYSFTFELYPESTENIEEELKNLHIKTAYALHDKDVYCMRDFNKYKKKNDKEPEWRVGDPKKSHIHCVVKFDTLKSIDNVLYMLEPLGVKYVEPVHDERGMIRYLIHQDDDDKYKYDRSTIKTLCDYEINKFFELEKDMNIIFQELAQLIKSNEPYCFNFFLFGAHITDNYPIDYVKVLIKHNSYFKSMIQERAKL